MHFLRKFSTHQLPEIIQKNVFRKALVNATPNTIQNSPEVKKIIDAGMASFLLHVRSRQASYQGQGFYTIGPCGEELLGGIALALQPQDSLALHYRHLATNLVRNMHDEEVSYQQLLDRAYGYTVSKLDPISKGRHCLLGGHQNDFLTTSTLASQVPSALGRALAAPSNGISMVTLGDGSINHSHFLASLNSSAHFSYLGKDTPIVFGVSVNDISISYKLNNWTQEFAKNLPIKEYQADSTNYLSIIDQTKAAVEYTREMRKPTIVFYNNITRRFGHAATDRQQAYLSEEEIEKMQNTDVLLQLCLDNYSNDILERFDQLDLQINQAFEEAEYSNKISRAEQIFSTSAPKVEFTPPTKKINKNKKADVMRKSMTTVYHEILANYPESRYIGEDVEHGGYYLVSDQLKEKFPNQVQDFPPDETTLIGAAIGYAQMKLVPIVEIPYAKYLDCGMDMFTEACLLNWLSANNQSNGMLIRLQGFERGTFGGNFHTHNGLYFPPGLDVICFSNGEDYAAGIRYAFQQAKAGRVVMTIDSTNLLNQRNNKTTYPNLETYITFDDFKIHHSKSDKAIVTYSTGVDLALQTDADVIELYCLSEIPTKINLKKYSKVVFADVCKLGSGPLAYLAVELHNRNKLPSWWRCISAPKVYHPLGQSIDEPKGINSTFLTLDDLNIFDQ